jgi:hypothetical protein
MLIVQIDRKKGDCTATEREAERQIDRHTDEQRDDLVGQG